MNACGRAATSALRHVGQLVRQQVTAGARGGIELSAAKGNVGADCEGPGAKRLRGFSGGGPAMHSHRCEVGVKAGFEVSAGVCAERVPVGAQKVERRMV